MQKTKNTELQLELLQRGRGWGSVEGTADNAEEGGGSAEGTEGEWRRNRMKLEWGGEGMVR